MAELGARRVWWELKQVRPWYSRGLNAFTGVSMSSFYILAAIGAWKSRNSTLTLVVAGITIPFMGLIALTWAIWEGRFGWWFLVLWTAWAGIGAQRILQLARPE
jgi:ABC-type proline/glycine betaine transport system permease subunit